MSTRSSSRNDASGGLCYGETVEWDDNQHLIPLRTKLCIPPARSCWITNTISAFNVYMWIASGNLNKAVQWAKEKGLSVDNKLANLREPEYIALVHILIAQGQLDDADRLLLRLIENAKAGDRVFMMIEMRLMRAMILKAQADTTAVLGELKSALSLDEPGGLMRIFVSKGRPMAELLEEIIAVKKGDREVSKAGFSLAYVKKNRIRL